MGRAEEVKIKEERLLAMMQREELDAVVITNQNNFAWLTGGGDNHVVTAAERGVASIVFTPNGKYIVTTNIEAGRIMTEEVDQLGYSIEKFAWHNESARGEIVSKIIGGGKAGSDDGGFGLPTINDKIAPLRYSLLPEEIERYRLLGSDCSGVMNTVCRSIKAGMTENEIAAMLSKELYTLGVTPAVLLIAADDRVRKYRHPINTGKKIEQYGMLVACGQRHGLIVSLTRMVHFGGPPDELKKKHRAVTKIDTVINMETKVGAPIGEVFDKGVAQYAAQGFPDEWQLHHQGGPTGYSGRDFVGTSGEKRLVQPNQAFAWNPSITGTKSEDTMIVTDKGAEFISLATDWPMIEIDYQGQTVLREDILVL
jgi:Xaa-Pro aminopeptidase